MGLLRSSKVGSIASDAARALQDGRATFVARFWDEVMTFQGTGAVSGADEAVDAVEEAGWRLAHVAYAWVDSKKRGVGYYVFRRAADVTPTS